MSQYAPDLDLPLVDHMHERHRGIHWPFASTHKPEKETFYPDVDMRDYDTGYAIDIEVPGLSDRRSIKVEWTSKHDIMISGSLARPDIPSMILHQDPTEHGVEKTKGSKEEKKDESFTPILLVGERRTGSFHRRFHLPVEVDAANMRAKLENGLLKIRVDKENSSVRNFGQAQIE